MVYLVVIESPEELAHHNNHLQLIKHKHTQNLYFTYLEIYKVLTIDLL